MIKTFKFRIKDSSHEHYLRQQAWKVNYVFNYCNQAHFDHLRNRSKWLSKFGLLKLLTGTSKELGLHSDVVTQVGLEFNKRVCIARKRKLNWRSKKRSLGWVPWIPRAIKFKDDSFTFQQRTFRFFKHREIKGKILCGSFNQDSKGNWFVNITCEVSGIVAPKTGKSIGIDLGLKTIATCSDGKKFERENLTKKYEVKLAKAQRAKKKRQVANLHLKIKNIRKDFSHKLTTKLINENDKIFVGNVSSTKLAKTRMAKSVNDANWGTIKVMLEYKAVSLGRRFQVVNERYSTLTCSNCFSRSGPSGLSGLSVRNWECSNCGSKNDRDVNSAINILRFGLEGESPALNGSLSL